jgi:hypothetical protein
MSNILFILPSKGRPRMLQHTLDNLSNRVNTSYTIGGIVNDGDKETTDIMHKNGHPACSDIEGVVKGVNITFKKYGKDIPIISFWSDDLYLRDDGIVDRAFKWLMNVPDTVAGVIFPYMWPDSTAPVIRYMNVPSTLQVQNPVKSGPAGYSTVQNPHFRGSKKSSRHTNPMTPFFNFGLLRSSVFNEVGMLSEEYNGYCVDDDLMMKMYVKGYMFGVMHNSHIKHIAPIDETYKNNLNSTLQYGLRIRTAKWGPLGYVEAIVGNMYC